MSAQQNYVSSSKPRRSGSSGSQSGEVSRKDDRRVQIDAEGGNCENGPLANRKSTPHPKALGVYSPPREAPRGSRRDENYKTDSDDSEAEHGSGYDSDGNHVQYATKDSNRIKVRGGWESSEPRPGMSRSSTHASTSSRKSSSSVKRSNTFQNTYPSDEYETDPENDSDAEYEERINANGDREFYSTSDNNKIRTLDEDSIRRREKAERKAARAEKRAKKAAKKAAEASDPYANAEYISDPEHAHEKPKFRRVKTAEGYAEESTGDNKIRTHGAAYAAADFNPTSSRTVAVRT